MALKELFTHNIGWKIGGVILALMLWIHLTTEKHYEGEYTAEIEFGGLAEDLYVDTIEPPEVNIKIIASGKQLAYLDLINEPRIKIDLSSVKSTGTYEYNITLLQIYNIDPYEYSSVDFPSNGRCEIVVKRRT